MHLYRSLRRHGYEVSVLAFSAGTCALFMWFARLDVGGEDGVYYTPAIALRDGLTIHKDVFSQYGPVFAEFQAMFFRVADADSVISLRYLNSVLLTLTGLVATATFTRIYGKASTFGALITWSASAYFFSRAIPMLAWPSVLSLLLSVTVLFLLVGARGAIRPSPSHFVLAGLVSGTQIFIRLNLGVTTTIGLYVVLALIGFSSVEVRRSVLNCAGSLTAGLTAACLFWAGRLYRQDALEAFLDQSLRAPADYYLSSDLHPGITNGEVPIQHMARFAILYGLPAVAVIGTLAAFSYFQLFTRSRSFATRASAILVLSTCVVLWRSGLAQDTFARFSVLYGMVLVVAIGGPALVLALTSDSIRREEDRGSIEMKIGRILALGFAIASVVQLYPGDDPRHLFWVGLVPIMVVLGELGLATLRPVLLSVFSAAWAVLAAIGPALENAQTPRVEVIGPLAYSGLLVTPDVNAQIDAISRSLESIPEDERSIFLCDDAQLSTWFKQFRSSDRMYVTWPWQLNYASMKTYRSTTLASANYVVFCGSLDDAVNWGSIHSFKILNGEGPIMTLERVGKHES